MQIQFLPPDYEQFLYQQYQNCWQVTDTARYIGGLKHAIQDHLALQGVWTLPDAVNLAMKMENHINRSSAHPQNHFRKPSQEGSPNPRVSVASASSDYTANDVS